MLARILFALLLAMSTFAQAQSTAGRCWLKTISVEPGGIRLMIDATVELNISQNGNAINAPETRKVSSGSSEAEINSSKSWEIVIQPNDKLEISTPGKRSNRCLIEPVIGPSFSGVSTTVWSFSAKSDQPIVLARIIRADRE